MSHLLTIFKTLSKNMMKSMHFAIRCDKLIITASTQKKISNPTSKRGLASQSIGKDSRMEQRASHKDPEKSRASHSWMRVSASATCRTCLVILRLLILMMFSKKSKKSKKRSMGLLAVRRKVKEAKNSITTRKISQAMSLLFSRAPDSPGRSSKRFKPDSPTSHT